MFEASFVVLERVRLDDLRDARREGRHHTVKIDVAVAAGQVVVAAFTVVVQVNVDCFSPFKEGRQVAIYVGMPHVEGEAEVPVDKAVEELRRSEEADLPRPHVLDGEPDIHFLLDCGEVVERAVESGLCGLPHLFSPDVPRVDDQPFSADPVADPCEIRKNPDSRSPEVLVLGCDVDIGDRCMDGVAEIERTADLLEPEEGVGTVGEDLRTARAAGDETERLLKRPVHQAAGGAADSIFCRHVLNYCFCLRHHASAATHALTVTGVAGESAVPRCGVVCS